MKITSRIKGYWVDVMFDGIVHFRFKQSSVEGIQTWIEAKDCFDIYVYRKNDRTIHLTYAKKEVWEEVINIICNSI